MTSSLLHVEKESLEVLAFRVVDVDGVVSGLVQTIEDTDAAAGLGGGGEHGEGKGLLVNDLRAAEREDQASGSDLGDRGGVQTLIGTEGALFRAPLCLANAGGSTIIRSYLSSGTLRRNSMASAQ